MLVVTVPDVKDGFVRMDVDNVPAGNDGFVRMAVDTVLGVLGCVRIVDSVDCAVVKLASATIGSAIDRILSVFAVEFEEGG